MKKFVLIFALFISSCESFAPTEDVMESWIGKNINDVVKVWGKPDEVKIVENKKYFYWERREIVTDSNAINNYGNIENYSASSLNYTQSSFISQSMTREKICKKYFEVNKNNIVTSWNVGSDCSNYEAKSLANPDNLRKN